MLLPACPACRYPNQADATRCAACGATLPHSALWLDDLRRPPLAPPAPASPASRPPREPITLRDVVPPPASIQPAVRARPAPPPPPPPPPLEGLIVSDLEPQQVIEAAERRAAKRAAVRRARNQAVAAAAPDTVPEVLVLDADNAARARLRDLLVLFGFGVHAVTEPARAAELVAERPFVACFFDVALDESDGGAGIDVCRLAKQAGSLLVLTSAPLRPVERVRAGLAGFDELLAKPLTRGAVARVLDARGVALPSDARRG